jgi:biofilm PGA synthesis N-glycosyltransferase PgaC
VSVPVAAVVAVVLIGAGWLVYQAPRGTTVPGNTIEQATEEIMSDPVLVGAGPLVRAVRVGVEQGGQLPVVDASTGTAAGSLTGADAAKARGHRHVLQRYGYPAGVRRTISLTFDDGPAPAYTPQLLDLLSREHVPATFFDVGTAMVNNPDMVRREAREGHLVANHSLTHANLSLSSDWRARTELVVTDSTIRDLTGRQTPIVRLPYEGDDEGSTQEAIKGILRAQGLGYVVASHDFDSLDWYHAARGRLEDIPLPTLDGSNLTVLLHDGGGNRRLTVAYTAKLIAAARAQGYTFTTMATSQAGLVPPSGPVAATRRDRTAATLAAGLLAWPGRVLDGLFIAALGSVVLSAGFSVLSLVRTLRRRRRPYPPVEEWNASVAVVLAAFNEEAVIRRTLEHILASTHPLTDVVVVDDGSTDRTAAIVDAMTHDHPQLRLIRQRNTGKSGALNRGLRTVTADVVVTMDADTVLTPDTVGNLVRHFAVDPDGRLGAVAGVVRVGNRTRNLLTRWQALEYLTQIGVERSAHDALRAIAIVPGACAAWRREAVLGVGGYSHDTLAEDCDLTLSLHRAGWRITQDDEALAFTEAPEDVDGLLAQRIRWSYGTLQAVVKHRDMLMRPRYRMLGLLVLPNYLLSIVLPLVFLPLTTLMAYLLVRTEGWGALAWYAVVFTGAHLVVATVAVFVMRESPRHLVMVPVYRLVFEPLRAYLVYNSALMAVKGIRAGWNKLERTGQLDAAVAETVVVPQPDELVADAVVTMTIDLRRSTVLLGEGARR